MKERPILFNGQMVRAILEGRKTQTRRVVKARGWKGPKVDPLLSACSLMHLTGESVQSQMARKCPIGQPGDKLWVREAWEPHSMGKCLYRADGEDQVNSIGSTWHKWKPSIHMSRQASRIDLLVKTVRAENLQSISEADAWKEGIRATTQSVSRYVGEGVDLFVGLWDSINRDRGFGWDTNPWVWVVEFEMLSKVSE